MGIIILLGFVIVIGSFIDACLHPLEQWDAIPRSKWLWLIMMVLFGIFAAVPYLIWARPDLEKQKNA